MTEPNIYDFISNPYPAVKAGYRPGYMDCVSAVSQQWTSALDVTWRGALEFREVWSMEVGEAFKHTMHLTFCLLIVVFFPLCMWPLAAVQYANIEHYIKALESEEDLD